MGVVIHGSWEGGRFRVTLAVCYEVDISVLEAKVEAVRVGLLFAANCGLSSLDIETDPLGMVNLMKGSDPPLSYVSSLCVDIKNLLSIYVGCKANGVAYRLP